MVKNKEIKKAMEDLEEISCDYEVRRIAELKEKYILDQRTIKKNWTKVGIQKGLEEGIQKGLEEGIQKGLKEGIKQGEENVAKKMLSMGINIDIIKEATSLSDEQLKQISKHI